MDISNLSIPKGGKIIKSPNPKEIIFKLDNRDYYTGIFLIIILSVFSIIVSLQNLFTYVLVLPMLLSFFYALINLLEYITVTIIGDNTLVIKTLFKKYTFNIDEIDDIFVEVVSYRPNRLAGSRSYTKQYLFIKCGTQDSRILTNADYDNLKFIESLIFEIKGWEMEEE